MMEALFGTAPPLWNTVPLASPAWAPLTSGGRTPNGGVQMPAPSQIRMSADALGGTASVPLSAFTGGFGLSGPFATFGATEVLAPTAALVSAVAIRRGQPAGPTTDAEVDDFLNDALDLVPGTADVEVRCEGGRVTLTGSVSQKRHKRDVGEIAWTIPSVIDVQNNVVIVARRRARASAPAREADGQTGPVRKHA
jgi:hypothetical protein